MNHNHQVITVDKTFWAKSSAYAYNLEGFMNIQSIFQYFVDIHLQSEIPQQVHTNFYFN